MCRLAVVILLILCACDTSGPCVPVRDAARQHLAIIATTRGETFRSFPLFPSEPDVQGLRAQDTRLDLVGDDLLLVTAQGFARIFRLSSGAPVASLNSDPTYVSRGSALYSASTQVGWYTFAPDIQTANRALSSSVERLSISPDGDTSKSVLFTDSIRRIDDDRFESTRYLLALPQVDGSILYVQEHEINTVTTDSLRTQVYFDRYHFERSLWRFSEGTHHMEMTLPDPMVEGGISYFDYTPDGSRFVYEDQDQLYFVDAARRSVRLLNRAGSHDPLWNPRISPEAHYALALESSCAQSYRVIDLRTEEQWTGFSTTFCSSNTAAFAPEDDAVYFGDTRGDSIGIWSQPVTRRLFSDDPSPEAAFVANDVIPVRRHVHLASMSAPLFLSADTFIVLHSYSGLIDECD